MTALHIFLRENSTALYTWNHDKPGFMQRFSSDLWIVTGMQTFSGPSFETLHKAKENCLVKETTVGWKCYYFCQYFAALNIANDLQ